MRTSRVQVPERARWVALGLCTLIAATAHAQSSPPLAEWLPQLRKGLWVKVEGALEDGVLRAEEIRVVHGELDQSELASVVTSVDSSTMRFTTQLGVVVVATPRTDWQKDAAERGFAALRADIVVEADGQMQRDGTLLADEIEVYTPSSEPRPPGWFQEHELTGRIDAVDAAARSVTVLGVTVRFDEHTRNKTRFHR
jgi:hypothetical protein